MLGHVFGRIQGEFLVGHSSVLLDELVVPFKAFVAPGVVGLDRVLQRRKYSISRVRVLRNSHVL
jgi:hypothetical protein